MASTLSARGRDLVANAPFPPYIEAHSERQANRCHLTDNPDGYIGLCVAENKLVWDLLQPRLAAPRPHVPHEAICYDESIGSPVFRQQLSDFLARRVFGREFPIENIAVLAGTGSVLEILFHNIADPGDGVLVPTPSYAGFWADLETRDQLSIVPVHTTSEEGFALTADLLDQAMQTADRPIKALLYTNPDNPTGAVADRAELEMVIDWSDRNGVHLVLDEVYALSIHADKPFVSGTTLVPELGDRIHALWAFSKDFGASGLRCGVFVTENEELMEAMGALGYWSLVSGDTQHLLGEMISDTPWVDGYIDAMRGGLRDSYAEVTATLDEEGLDHIPALGGYFFLLDLRKHLDEQTWEAEDRLWDRIVEEANVNVTPGSACRNGEPGFMRVCFATEPADVVVEGMRRIAKVVSSQ